MEMTKHHKNVGLHLSRDEEADEERTNTQFTVHTSRNRQGSMYRAYRDLRCAWTPVLFPVAPLLSIFPSTLCFRSSSINGTIGWRCLLRNLFKKTSRVHKPIGEVLQPLCMGQILRSRTNPLNCDRKLYISR